MRFKYYIPSIIWAAIILVLTLSPGKYIPPVNFFDLALDKGVHAFIFFVLACLLLWGQNKQQDNSVSRKKTALISISLGIFYGMFTEYLQSFTPDRMMDWQDGVADGVGTLFGCLSYFFLIKDKKKAL